MKTSWRVHRKGAVCKFFMYTEARENRWDKWCAMILNFGSINIDHVYRVTHMPAPGETLAVKSYERFLGGKGANQSIAIAKSGGTVRHIGAVGADGDWALGKLNAAGVAPAHVARVEEPTGHAVIAVDDYGENQILICGGANQALTLAQVDAALDGCTGLGHWVLLQNETNLTAQIVRQAKARGFRVAYSAAPFVAEHTLPLLETIDLLAVNALEAEALSRAMNVALEDLPVPSLLVTRGEEGAAYVAEGEAIEQTAFSVEPKDTTGAGDTFLGAFLAHLTTGNEADAALRFASAASAIQITRPGAADAIPGLSEIEQFLEERPG